MKDIIKHYTNGEVTIVWQPSKCIHSTVCFRGLPGVFDPRRRPWITPEGVASEAIIDQVKKCPSGALSIADIAAKQKPIMENQATNTLVEVNVNGPLCVHGTLTVKDALGNSVEKMNKTFFCRCGASSNKPYCDGSHKKNGFQG
jgi:uncharacterized Fe-S cluster protein YjdI/CDGSH-type Zn-finger protein